jgi:methyl-accepting chemotaxis protein
MNFKQWGIGLRAIFAILLSLPLIGFGVVAWFGFTVVGDLVEVTKKSIVELPAEKGVEVANMLARVHDRSEVIMLVVPLLGAAALIAINGIIFGRFFSSLAADCLAMVASAKQMGSLGEHFNKSTEKLAMGATQSSAALEQSIGSLESLSSALQRTAVDVGEADKAARIAAEQSTRGEGELKTVVDSLAELSSQSRKLEEIINVIDSIAFQTNILAVNAAVEAARAGEQGRGFAIVAEAVRNLAQNSAVSAKNISSLIRDSGETSKRALDAVRNGAESLGAAVGQVRKSQTLIHKISTSTHDLTEALTRISQSLSHLDSTTRTVFDSADLSDATQEQFKNRIALLQNSANSLGAALVNLEAVSDEESKYEVTATSTLSQINKRPEKKIPQNVPLVKKPNHNVAASSASFKESSNFQNRSTAHQQVSSLKVGKGQAKARARDVIPFEGENESEANTDVKLGTTSGF